MRKILRKFWRKRPGKDHIAVNAKVVSNGMSYRIMLEEGVLKAIGAAAIASHGGGHQGGHTQNH